MSFLLLPREFRDMIYEACINVATYDYDATPKEPPEPEVMNSDIKRFHDMLTGSAIGNEYNYAKAVPKNPPNTLDFLASSFYEVLPIAATCSSVRKEVFESVVQCDAVTFLIPPWTHSLARRIDTTGHITTFLSQLHPEAKAKMLSRPINVRFGKYNNTRCDLTIFNTSVVSRFGVQLRKLQDIGSIRIFAGFKLRLMHAPEWTVPAGTKQILTPDYDTELIARVW